MAVWRRERRTQNEMVSVKRNEGTTLRWRGTLRLHQDGFVDGEGNTSESGSSALILLHISIHFHHISNFQPLLPMWMLEDRTTLTSEDVKEF